MLDWSALLERTKEILCHAVEICSKIIHPHPYRSAAAIYLSIIVLIAIFAIVRPRSKYIAKVMHYNWSETAANHVWIFTLAIFLANGVMHAFAQTTWLAPDGSPSPPLGDYHIPFAANISIGALLRSLFNLAFGLGVLIFYIWDSYNHELRIEITKRATAYFGPVVAAWGAEDVISMYWDHYETRGAVVELTQRLPTWAPEYVLAAIVLAVLVSPICWFCRKKIYGMIVAPSILGTFLSVAAVTIGVVVALILTGHQLPLFMFSQGP
jgi:hypothetical protein